MGIGLSVLLAAIGAILIWAVNATVAGIEVTTIGWILLIAGIAGALLSLVFWSSMGARTRRDDGDVVVHDRR